MRGKLDENMPTEAGPLLEAAGWECTTVHDEHMSGADDVRLSEVCRAEERVLLTLDLDFADIRAYPPSEYIGIVVLRPVEPSRDTILQLLGRVIPVLAQEWTAHRLWIVEPHRVRVRSGGESAV